MFVFIEIAVRLVQSLLLLMVLVVILGCGDLLESLVAVVGVVCLCFSSLFSVVLICCLTSSDGGGVQKGSEEF